MQKLSGRYNVLKNKIKMVSHSPEGEGRLREEGGREGERKRGRGGERGEGGREEERGGTIIDLTTSSFGNCLVMEISFNSFSIRRMFSLQSVATCIRSTSCVSVSVESTSCASVLVESILVLVCQSNQYLC